MIALNNPDLLEAVPSIFATAPHPKVSEGYHFVSTADIIGRLEDVGWGIMSANQQRVKDATERQYAKHSVTMMRHGDSSGKETRPTLRIVNSHNWASLLQIHIGMLRLICSNGLMASFALASWTVRHDRIKEDLQQILDRFQSVAAIQFQEMETWKGIQLNSDQQREFAIGAAKLRFADSEGNELESYADSMNAARRQLDVGPDLWRTFNRLQENGMKGEFRLAKRIARPIRNIQADLNFNIGLHRLASSFAPSMN